MKGKIYKVKDVDEAIKQAGGCPEGLLFTVFFNGGDDFTDDKHYRTLDSRYELQTFDDNGVKSALLNTAIIKLGSELQALLGMHLEGKEVATNKDASEDTEHETETIREKFNREVKEHIAAIQKLCKQHEASYVIGIQNGGGMLSVAQTFNPASKHIHRAIFALAPEKYEKEEIIEMFFK